MGQSSYVKFVVIFLVIIGLGVGGYFLFRSENPYEQAERAMKQFEEAMRADTYGGKTPQETLDLFVAALRAGDVELASKYFLLEQNENDPGYLTRKKWVDRLNEVKNRGLLEQMVDDIETLATPDPDSKTSENDFKFVLFTKDGKFGAFIDMQFNAYSNVWKIESL